MGGEQMQFEHQERRPRIDPGAWVAPTAALVGDVRVGPGSAVCHGAILNAEDGMIEIGANCVVMENAVIKASRRAPVLIGSNVLVGPRAYLTGCTIRNDVFLATGAAVFNHAVIGERAEVRINGVVHLRTVVPADATVPIGWVAVGDPAHILPPDRHDEIWAIQQPLDFPKTVFGVDRPPAGETIMPRIMERYARAMSRHRNDTAID
jgi:carbonic anhydrase/acetyltransferase-like protein (isoleucine patch superfamily)